jgi:hypothetical protein
MPVLLYESASLTLRKEQMIRMETVEICFLLAIVGFRMMDSECYEAIREKLRNKISLLSKELRTLHFYNVCKMPDILIPKLPYQCKLRGRRFHGRPKFLACHSRTTWRQLLRNVGNCYHPVRTAVKRHPLFCPHSRNRPRT